MSKSAQTEAQIIGALRADVHSANELRREQPLSERRRR